MLGTDHALKDDGTAAPILTLKGGALDTLAAGAARVQNVRIGPTAEWRLLASEERLRTFSPAGPRSEADPTRTFAVREIEIDSLLKMPAPAGLHKDSIDGMGCR